MANGRITLHHFNGVEEFSLASAVMLAFNEEDGIRLRLEVETDLEVLQFRSHTEVPSNPTVEVAILLKEFDPRNLSGKTFSVTRGYDKHTGVYVADIFSCDYVEALNENEIEFIAQVGDQFYVYWTGMMKDVNDYDGSRPKIKVEIDGWFTFTAIEMWLPTNV